jgi:hypothetical protein
VRAAFHFPSVSWWNGSRNPPRVLLPRRKKGLEKDPIVEMTTKPDSDFVYCRGKLGLPLDFFFGLGDH